MEVEPIKTVMGVAEELEQNMFCVRHYPYRNNDLAKKEQFRLEDAQNHFYTIKERMVDGLYYVVADLRATKRPPTKEVRDFMASKEVTQYIGGLAVLVKSGVSKMFGNIFLKFSKPDHPTKIFTNEAQAKEWLKQLKAENN